MRERDWSPAPSDRDSTAWPSASEPETTFSQGAFSSDSGAASSAPTQDANDATESGSFGSGHRKLEPGGAAGQPETTASGSGYRLGTPRVQGPDPYHRFDDSKDANQAPSNLQHFPTPPRELGDDLKLSELLGARSSKADPGQKVSLPERENEHTKTDPDADLPSTDEQD